MIRRLIRNLLIILVGLIVAFFGLRYLLIRPITCTPNCIGINLTGRDLSNLDLVGVVFIEATLANTNLTGANLREADLSGADMRHTMLRNADLTNAKLIGADLSQADLNGSILDGADLSGARLVEADLTGVDLTATAVSGASFSKAKLTDATLTGAKLGGIEFTEANLSGANLAGANLAGASVSRADLSGAVLVQADLTGAWLNLANLTGADLTGASLLGGAMIGGRFTSANLTSANLQGANAIGAVFDGANLRNADLRRMRTRVEQLGPNDLALDPILVELNDLQRRTLLVETLLNGVISDARTRWPTASANATAVALSAESTVVTGTSTLLTTPVPGAAAASADLLALAPLTATLTAPLVEPLPNTDILATTEEALALAEEASSQAWRVKTNFYINSIRQIDNANGTFEADFYLDLFWNQPELAGQAIRTINPAQLADPVLDVVNARRVNFKQRLYENSFNPDTNVRLRSWITGDFISAFDLRDYPLDTQTFSLQFESVLEDSEQLLFDFIGLAQPVVHSVKPYSQSVPRGRYIARQVAGVEWAIQDVQIQQLLHVLPYDNSSWSQFRVDVIMQRRPPAIFWRVLLLLDSVLLLAWSVLWLDGQQLPIRLWLLCLLFALIGVLNAILAHQLPLLAYLTLLDRYVLTCYALVVFLAAVVILIQQLRERRLLMVAAWLNRAAAILYPVLIVGIHVLFFLNRWI